MPRARVGAGGEGCHLSGRQVGPVGAGGHRWGQGRSPLKYTGNPDRGVSEGTFGRSSSTEVSGKTGGPPGRAGGPRGFETGLQVPRGSHSGSGEGGDR